MRISDWSSDVCSSDLWRMNTLFDSLLAPLDAETFFRDYFGKQHLHVKGSPERTSGIMTLAGLNALMSMTSVWSPPTLKLFVDRNPVPVPDSSEARRVAQECVSTCISRWSR